MDIFLAPSLFVEQLYFGSILHYDQVNVSHLNWVGTLAVLLGAGFTYYYFAVKKDSYKSTFLIGFLGILIYLVMMYFRVDYQTTKAMLVAPIFFRNFGYVVIAIVLITNLVKLPFHHFFQGVALQGMVSAACGALLGSAILQRLFDHITTKNFQLISSSLDRVNPYLNINLLRNWEVFWRIRF